MGRHSSLDIVALAQEIQNADIGMHNQSGKLGLIIEQIRFLQSQAQQILRDIKTDQSLHQAACNFKKIPGKTYYLYERESGQMYFSMLSPQVRDRPQITDHTSAYCLHVSLMLRFAGLGTEFDASLRRWLSPGNGSNVDAIGSHGGRR